MIIRKAVRAISDLPDIHLLLSPRPEMPLDLGPVTPRKSRFWQLRNRARTGDRHGIRR